MSRFGSFEAKHCHFCHSIKKAKAKAIFRIFRVYKKEIKRDKGMSFVQCSKQKRKKGTKSFLYFCGQKRTKRKMGCKSLYFFGVFWTKKGKKTEKVFADLLIKNKISKHLNKPSIFY